MMLIVIDRQLVDCQHVDRGLKDIKRWMRRSVSAVSQKMEAGPVRADSLAAKRSALLIAPITRLRRSLNFTSHERPQCNQVRYDSSFNLDPIFLTAVC